MSNLSEIQFFEIRRTITRSSPHHEWPLEPAHVASCKPITSPGRLCSLLLCDSTATPSDSLGHYFLVVFVGTLAKEVYAYIYSSQAGAYGATTHAHSLCSPGASRSLYNFVWKCAYRQRGRWECNIYFGLCNTIRILKYDLGAQEISSVDLPPGCHATQGLKFCSRLQNMADWKLPEWTSQGLTYCQWRPVWTGLSSDGGTSSSHWSWDSAPC